MTLLVLFCIVCVTANKVHVGTRFISSTSNNNNNNNNNNNVNVNVNYNTVVTSSVTIISNHVTCHVNGLVYGLAEFFRVSCLHKLQCNHCRTITSIPQPFLPYVTVWQYHVTLTSFSASFPRQMLLDSEKKIAGTVSADGCTKCSCTQTGMVCSSLNCQGHQPVKTDFHKCKYSGVTHNFGDIFTHADGCNKCVCGLSSIQCTDAVACKPTTPSYDCTYQGTGYMSGQSFSHTDNCNLCQCTILGVICTSKTCTTTTTTTTMAPYTCEWFGAFYHDGDVMQGDGCHTCTCQGGQAICSATLNCPVSP